jgi:hypothetical protein
LRSAVAQIEKAIPTRATGGSLEIGKIARNS